MISEGVLCHQEIHLANARPSGGKQAPLAAGSSYTPFPPRGVWLPNKSSWRGGSDCLAFPSALSAPLLTRTPVLPRRAGFGHPRPTALLPAVPTAFGFRVRLRLTGMPQSDACLMRRNAPRGLGATRLLRLAYSPRSPAATHAAVCDSLRMTLAWLPPRCVALPPSPLSSLRSQGEL